MVNVNDILDELVGQPTVDSALVAQTDLEITSHELADLIGVGIDQIGSLSKKGATARVAKGRYFQRASVHAYCEHLRKLADGRGTDAFQAERQRATKAQADQRELALAQQAGKLIKADEVQDGLERLLADLRAAILAVPTRMTDLAPQARAKLDRELRDTLEGLSLES